MIMGERKDPPLCYTLMVTNYLEHLYIIYAHKFIKKSHLKIHKRIISDYDVCMKFSKEVVHEPEKGLKRHLSSIAIGAQPFSLAKVKQGGYGYHGDDFWLQRISQRGFHVFVFTISGHGEITLEDGTLLEQNPGDIFVSWSTGQGHYERTPKGEEWEMLWITLWDSTPFTSPTCSDWYMLNNKRDGMIVLRNLMLQIFNEELYDDARSPEALELYEKLFLIYLERVLNLTENYTSSSHREKLQPLWDKVALHLDEEWKIERLSEEAGYSRSHFVRLCLELYGKNPGEIVRKMKMHQAEVMLRNSDLSIGLLAERVGFKSLSTFSSAFKDYFGITPREYRKISSKNERLEISEDME